MTSFEPYPKRAKLIDCDPTVSRIADEPERSPEDGMGGPKCGLARGVIKTISSYLVLGDIMNFVSGVNG
jgi:hypothetical protein